MSPRSLRLGLMAALLSVGTVAGAVAQSGPSPGMMGQGWMGGPGMMGPGSMGQGWMGGPGMTGPGMMGQGMMMGPGMMGAWVENQLAALRSDLHLGEAQRPAFDDYAKVVRDGTTSMMSGMMMGSGAMGWQGNAPQMMELMQQHMQARVDAIQQLRTALEKLYSQLTAEQKAVLDRYAMMGMM